MASGNTLAAFTALSRFPYPSANAGQDGERNAHPTIDLSLTDIAIFGGTMPSWYTGGGITITVRYAMASATTGNVEITADIERIDDGSHDIDADSFTGAGNHNGDKAVPGTTGEPDDYTITFTDGVDMDSVAATDSFRLKLERTAASASDAAGDLQILHVIVKET